MESGINFFFIVSIPHVPIISILKHENKEVITEYF